MVEKETPITGSVVTIVEKPPSSRGSSSRQHVETAPRNDLIISVLPRDVKQNPNGWYAFGRTPNGESIFLLPKHFPSVRTQGSHSRRFSQEDIPSSGIQFYVSADHIEAPKRVGQAKSLRDRVVMNYKEVIDAQNAVIETRRKKQSELKEKLLALINKQHIAMQKGIWAKLFDNQVVSNTALSIPELATLDVEYLRRPSFILESIQTSLVRNDAGFYINCSAHCNISVYDEAFTGTDERATLYFDFSFQQPVHASDLSLHNSKKIIVEPESKTINVPIRVKGADDKFMESQVEVPFHPTEPKVQHTGDVIELIQTLDLPYQIGGAKTYDRQLLVNRTSGHYMDIGRMFTLDIEKELKAEITKSNPNSTIDLAPFISEWLAAMVRFVCKKEALPEGEQFTYLPKAEIIEPMAIRAHTLSYMWEGKDERMKSSSDTLQVFAALLHVKLPNKCDEKVVMYTPRDYFSVFGEGNRNFAFAYRLNKWEDAYTYAKAVLENLQRAAELLKQYQGIDIVKQFNEYLDAYSVALDQFRSQSQLFCLAQNYREIDLETARMTVSEGTPVYIAAKPDRQGSTVTYLVDVDLLSLEEYEKLGKSPDSLLLCQRITVADLN